MRRQSRRAFPQHETTGSRRIYCHEYVTLSLSSLHLELFSVNTYGLSGQGKRALDLFDRMPRECISDATYVCILNACSHSGLIADAHRIFGQIPQTTPQICSTMVREEISMRPHVHLS